MENLWLILIGIISYLLGSIPFSYLLGRKQGKDILEEGSKNVGAMNVFRSTKKVKTFILALLGDIGKGAIAIFLVSWLSFLGYNFWIALILAAFFVVLGHNYPVFLRFKGGRGISSLMGILLALNWLSFFAWGLTVFAVIIIAQYLLVGKINWKKFSEVFSMIASQIAGRAGGIVVSLIPIYFFGPRLFFPVLAAVFLVSIKHIDRVKDYLKELELRR